MRKMSFLLISVVCVFVACSDGSEGSYYKGKFISEHKFPKIVELKGERIVLPDSVIMGASEVKIFDTTLMLFYDWRDYGASVIDSRDYAFIRYAFRIGNGPKEFGFARYIGQNWRDENGDLKLLINDVGKLKVCVVNYDKLLNGDMDFHEKIADFPAMSFFNPFRLDDKRIMFNESNALDKRVYQSIYDIEKEKIVKKYPITNYDFDMRIGGRGQSLFTINREGTKIVMAGSLLNQIAIFDIESGKSVIFSTNEKLENWEYFSKGEWDDMPFAYYFPVSTKDYIMVPTTGDESEIHILDWNGNPVLKIITPYGSLSIDYDESNNILYAITRDEELYKIDLKGVI